jgi:hypothetical protein
MNWTTDPSSPGQTCRPSGAVNGLGVINPTAEDKQLLLIAMGLIGGVGIGYHAFHHLFVEGMEDDARKNMIKFGAGAAVLYGLSMIVDLEPYKYLINPFAWLDEQVGGENAQIP